MNMWNLRRLGKGIRVQLPTDENGYTGRECPSPGCQGYFKVVSGTGLPAATACHCPYCGHTADQWDFVTADQMEYVKSVALRKSGDAVLKDLKSREFDIKPKGPFGIGLSMKVEAGQRHPIHWYREKALETHAECSNCTLKYAVFGVFAFCPDCGQHNSLQILGKNVGLVGKVLDMAATAEAELADRLIENALEDCVSAFDGFGREISRLHANKSSDPAKAETMSFQNLEKAKQKVTGLFGFDLAAGLGVEEWKAAIRGFQKRHLLSHKMGVVDGEYIRKSGDTQAVVGRKVGIGSDEVRELATIVSKLARHVAAEMGK